VILPYLRVTLRLTLMRELSAAERLDLLASLPTAVNA
jgi:hypothetical protein